MGALWQMQMPKERSSCDLEAPSLCVLHSSWANCMELLAKYLASKVCKQASNKGALKHKLILFKTFYL